jgi:hypothetical protein
LTGLPPPNLPAGWYPDPEDENQERFWDGRAWTDKTAPIQAPVVETAPSPTSAALAVPPKKGGLGCTGIGCLSIVGIVLISLILSWIIGASENGNSDSGRSDSSNISNGSGGSSGSGSSGSGSSGSPSDPIEQARVVLSNNYGSSYSYAAVKSATDSALSATGTPLTDDSRSRAWSAVLSVLKAPELSSVDPMDVMSCAAVPNAAGAGVSLPDLIAICAVSLM